MVGPQARRDAVLLPKQAWQLSERRVCGLVGITVSVLRYQARADRNGELRERITAIAQERRRFDYRRIHVLLERDGWVVNIKRTYRIYREAGLAVRKRLGLTERIALTYPD